MVIRFPARKLIAILAVMALSACEVDVNNPTPNLGPDRTAEEAELARQSRALTRTIMEGAVAGTATFGVFGAENGTPGVFLGLPVGIAAGTYVGMLQRQYRNKELRLERVRQDIQRSNAEVAAAIQTMRVVLAQQQRELNAIRSSATAAQSPELTRELGQAQSNLDNMRVAIQGAETRREEFGTTRSLQLVDEQITGIDPEIAELSARIQTMRQIADTLAREI